MPEIPPATNRPQHHESSSLTGKVRLVVLFGGQSAEHDVSCVSARHVIAAANPEKYLVEPIGIDRNGVWHRDDRTISAMSDRADGKRAELPERLTVEGEAIDALPVIAGRSYLSAADGSQVPTVVFPVLHGPMGEDGTVQGLLELADVAYVGAGVLASALCMDKVAAKAHMAADNIPQGDYTWLTVDQPPRHSYSSSDSSQPDGSDSSQPDGSDSPRPVNSGSSGSSQPEDLVTYPDGSVGTIDDAASRAKDRLGLPLFVKPANMGSSVGVSKAATVSEAAAAISLAAGYDRVVIIEEAIRGREIEVAVIGNENPTASVPGEIVPGAEFYDYADKYDNGAELRVPAPLRPGEIAAVQEMAVAAYRALRVEGLARVDFFYEDGLTGEDGRQHGDRGWLVSELNTMPGFTPISMYPKLWAETGLPYPDLIDQLIGLAIDRHERRIRHRRTDH